MTLALYFLTCGSSGGEEFSVSKWKAATKDQRRRMAEDFLKKYNSTGMSLEQVKELLGEPDYEHDSWRYNLSPNGPPPSGAQTEAVFLQHPQLCIHFKEGIVNEVDTCHGLGEEDDKRKNTAEFNADLWKKSRPQERLNMLASLLNSGILKGRGKEKVKQVLGNPDAQDEERIIEYDLGFRMLDMVTLTFTLGEGGKVLDAKIIEH